MSLYREVGLSAAIFLVVGNIVGIGIYTIDRHGNIDSFNPKMVDLSGAKSVDELFSDVDDRYER